MSENDEAWKLAWKLADEYREKSRGMSVVATDFLGSRRTIGGQIVVIDKSQMDWIVTTNDMEKAKGFRPDCPITRTLYAAALSRATFQKAWDNLRGIGDVIPRVRGSGTYSPMGEHLAYIFHQQGIQLEPKSNMKSLGELYDYLRNKGWEHLGKMCHLYEKPRKLYSAWLYHQPRQARSDYYDIGFKKNSTAFREDFFKEALI